MQLSSRSAFVFTTLLAFFVLLSYWYEPWAHNAEGQQGVLLVPRRWYMLIVFTLCCLLISILIGDQKLLFRRSDIKQDYRGGRLLTGFVAVVLLILSMYHAFSLDCFVKKYAWHHLHAYLNSILNLYWGQAFTETVTSIYGHYAFFYYPLIKAAKVFGVSSPMIAYIGVNVLLTAGIVSIWFFLLCRTVKNRALQILGMITISYLNTAQLTSIYPQMFPHRALPQAVMTLMVYLWYQKKNRRKLVCVSGYLICILLHIWNLEFGVFSSVAWSALLCCSELQERGKKAWFMSLIYIACIPATFFSAVLLCGFLNVFAGGTMIPVREFVFPLLDQGYMQDVLELPLITFPSTWMTIMLGLFLLLGLGLSDTIFGTAKSQKNDQTAVCFSLAILGLGAVSYAINRPTFLNFYIVMPLMGLIITIFAEQFSEQREIFFTEKWRSRQTGSKAFAAGLGTICMLVLSVLSVTALINIPNKVVQERSYHYSEDFKDFLEEFKMNVNEDAVAVGGCAANLYAMLGRDPGVYCMDFSDIFINEHAVAEGEELLSHLEGKSAVLSQDVKEFGLPEAFLETHVLASDFYYRDAVLEYYLPVYNN